MNLTCKKNVRASTLVETCIALVLISLVFVSLYAGITTCFATTRLVRENLRATQVLVQRMETVRLYTWNQLVSATNPVYLPANFTEYYDPNGKSSNSGGAVYTGTVRKSVPTNLPAAYRTNMRVITVEVTWNSGQVLRKRVMETYVAHYGIQNYLLK